MESTMVKNNGNAILGAIIGGVIGNPLGKGDGNKAPTALGALHWCND